MSGSTNRKLFVGAAFVVAVALASCSKPASAVKAMLDPTSELPAKFKLQEPVAIPDFRDAAQSPAFQQAIKDAAALLGSAPQPLRSEAENKEVQGGVSFDVMQEKVETLLLKAHTD